MRLKASEGKIKYGKELSVMEISLERTDDK